MKNLIENFEKDLEKIKRMLKDAEVYLRGIVKLPDSGWAGDEPREACFEARRMALCAIFALGLQTEQEEVQAAEQKDYQNDVCNKEKDDSDKTYFEIRMGEYSKDYRRTRGFGEWILKGKVTGRVEMCAGVPGCGDHREYGYERIRIPVKKKFFNKVMKMLEEEYKDSEISTI